MNERLVQDAARLEAQEIPGCVIWRNNNGAGIMVLPAEIQRLEEYLRGNRMGEAIGLVMEIRRRNVNRFGLVRGASDLIGLIEPHGTFIAAEVKGPRGRLTPEQILFLELVRQRGGIGVEYRERGDLTRAIEERKGR